MSTLIRLRSRRVFAWLGIALVAACGGGGVKIESSVDGVVRSRHGDTTIIVTARDGAWGPAHDAVEVLRVGNKSRETTFGSVSMLAATPDGGVVLFDSKSFDGMIIRQFNANGEFVRNLGRQGSGPGEYNQAGQLIIAVQPNGTILVRDGARAVNRYGANGAYINGFALGLTGAGTLDVVGGADGSIYVRGPFPRGTMSPVLPPMLRYDTLGTRLDSVVDKSEWLPGAGPTGGFFAPQQAWYLLTDGRLIFGRSDKVGFLVVDRTRKEKPLIAELETKPVAFLPEERAELEAREEMFRSSVPSRPGEKPRAGVPEFKLPMRGLVIDIDNRVWIYRSTTARKVEPRVGGIVNNKRISFTYAEPQLLAAFQLDGTFLGDVRFPMDTRPTFVGDFAWAILPNEDDGPVLVKYRLR